MFSAVSRLLTLFDADNDTLAWATVTITQIFDPLMELSFVNTSNTSIARALDATTGVLSLTGIDLVSAYQQVLQTVKYVNLMDEPRTNVRTLRFAVSDGDRTSVLRTSTISVELINDVPYIDLTSGIGCRARFCALQPRTADRRGGHLAEDSAHLVLANPLTLAVGDDDDLLLTTLVVELLDAAGRAAEALFFHNVPLVTAWSPNGSHTLTFGGLANRTRWAALISSVSYRNTDNDPDLTPRAIRFTISDPQQAVECARLCQRDGHGRTTRRLSSARPRWRRLTRTMSTARARPWRRSPSRASLAIRTMSMSRAWRLSPSTAPAARGSTPRTTAPRRQPLAPTWDAALLLSDEPGNGVRFVPGQDFNGQASITIRAWDRSLDLLGHRLDLGLDGKPQRAAGLGPEPVLRGHRGSRRRRGRLSMTRPCGPCRRCSPCSRSAVAAPLAGVGLGDVDARDTLGHTVRVDAHGSTQPGPAILSDSLDAVQSLAGGAHVHAAAKLLRQRDAAPGGHGPGQHGNT
jgi:hypothetical protein